MTGMTQKSCEVMWKASTVGFTTGWEINCPNTTLTVTRIDRIDRTDTYFRESTARRQRGGLCALFIMHSGNTNSRQMPPTTTARLWSSGTLGSRNWNTSRKRSPAGEEERANGPMMTKYEMQEPQV